MLTSHASHHRAESQDCKLYGRVWTVRNEQMGAEYEFLKKMSWAFLGFDGDTKIHNQTHSDIKVETVETIQEQFHNSPMKCSHPFPWS